MLFWDLTNSDNEKKRNDNIMTRLFIITMSFDSISALNKFIMSAVLSSIREIFIFDLYVFTLRQQ